jgi:hypothetical protein
MATPQGPYKPQTNTIKKASDILDNVVRKSTRTLALIILSYLAWKGVAGSLELSQLAREFAAYGTILGLLALIRFL